MLLVKRCIDCNVELKNRAKRCKKCDSKYRYERMFGKKEDRERIKVARFEKISKTPSYL